MTDRFFHDTAIRRLGGAVAVVSGLSFIAGVGLQFASGWFPEEALATGEMEAWLEAVAGARATALAGIGLSIVAIALWTFVGLVLYRFFQDEPTFALVGLAGYLAGVPLALVAFTFAFGATWGLVEAAGTPDPALSASLMRAFLVMDDLATFLIGGVGNGFFAIGGLRSGRLPKWLSVHGIVAAALVTVVLLRYVDPVFGLAKIGYPLVLLWFVLVGVVLVREGREAGSA